MNSEQGGIRPGTVEFNLANRLEVMEFTGKINRRRNMLNNVEVAIFRFLGPVIMALSVIGITVCCLADRLVLGLSPMLGWVQVAGILLCGGAYILGLTVQELHRKLVELVKKEEGN